MQLKSLSLVATLITTALVSGCASQPQPSHVAIPQALLVAAERASQARLVHADLAARMHGYSVDNVRLDGADAGLPAFMLAEVRLDYDGPMMQVLQRVAHDIGYRVNEYAKPPSGLSWTPWVHLSGSKPLVDHIRELNSQVPWHLVLDHRNKRLVIDYSADGSLASEVQSARDAMQANKSTGTVNLPNTASMMREGNRAAQREMTGRPAQQPRQAAAEPPRAAYATAPSPAAAQAEQQGWFAGVDGYDSREHAQAMVDWLGQEGFTSTIADRGNGYEVRVYAGSDTEAASVKAQLAKLGVPTRVGLDSDADLRQRAERAMQESQPAEFRHQPTEISNLPAATRQVERGNATAGSVSPQEGWNIQLLAGPNENALENRARALRSEGYTVYVLSLGSINALNAGPYPTAAATRGDLQKLRAHGYSDAFIVAPKKR